MEFGDIPLHCWSLRKQTMMTRCPREALLHYRDSRAGSDGEIAPAPARYLHHLRRCMNMNEYRRKVLRENMHKLFYRVLNDYAGEDAPHLVDDALRSCVLKQWESDWHNMLTGAYEKDHRLPCLLELQQHGTSFAALHKEVTAALQQSCDALEKGAWHTLQNTPFHLRRSITLPLTVHINELTCCCAPVCALERNGEFWMVESSRPDDRVALLHKFYAGIQRGYAPEKVRSFTIDDHTGEFREFGTTMDISAAIRQISRDTLAWKELLAAPEDADALLHRTGNCEQCRFFPVCGEKKG